MTNTETNSFTNESRKQAQDLADFIHQSPTAYHSTENLKVRLQGKGYITLTEGEFWNLKPGASYMVLRGTSALMAFTLGKSLPWESGFALGAAHTDSPGFKIRNQGLQACPPFLRMATEAYGSPLVSTWFDRDLGLAGRVLLRGARGLEQRLLHQKGFRALIPSLAAHLNRGSNPVQETNLQQHLQALSPLPVEPRANEPAPGPWYWLSRLLDLPEQEILDCDLFLCDSQAPSLDPSEDPLVTAPRLDNLSGCHALVQAQLATGPGQHSVLCAYFDHEEVGSRSSTGADSSFLESTLDRIVAALGGGEQERQMTRARSFLLSVDAAHGVHPNYADRHDPQYSPQLGLGPVIKSHGGMRYATTGSSAAFLEDLCRRKGIPAQRFITRSDMPTGSTVGPLLSAASGISAVDLGIPLWAMHSIRECARASDHGHMIQLLQVFFQEGPAGSIIAAREPGTT